MQWDLVHIPFKIPKHRWFSMIQNKFPNQPNRLNEEEIFCGIKELCQGAFRYFVSYISWLIYKPIAKIN